MTTKKKIMRTYSELITIPDFLGRYRYLKLGGKVGEDTFGFDRYLNQAFYKSDEWKAARRKVIIRDNGCDLGVEGFELSNSKIIIHHMNQITREQVLNRDPILFDPEYLISVSNNTHQAIHYGDENLLPITFLVERRPNDQCPWKSQSK